MASGNQPPLRPRLARQLLGLAQPLLPPGTLVGIWREGSCLAFSGSPASPALSPDDPGANTVPLLLEGETVATLVWRTPAASSALGEALVRLLAAAGSELVRAEQARHAVAAETLEAYRDMALMQRATQQLNHSLKPEEVAAAVLTELEAHLDAADWGAVYRFDPGDEAMVPIRTFGPGAETLFPRLGEQPLFQEIRHHRLSGIINDIRAHPAWVGWDDAPCHSLMALPLLAQQEKVGLLLLAGRQREGFRSQELKQAETLASLAAVALRNAQLFAAEQAMFRAFISVIAAAIDAKSPYTAGHCRRVPRIAQMLAEAAHQDQSEPFRQFTMNADDWYALEVATYLHDCGKVVTPEWIVDKKSKLETILDHIHLIALRIGLMKRELELEHGAAPDEEGPLRERLAQLDDDLAFLRECNRGSEFLAPDMAQRLRHLATLVWKDENGLPHPLLDPQELDNLLIQRGTLNLKERGIIEEHAVHTIHMLRQIPFPPALANVVEYAGGHHERLDGSGYPNHLTADQLSIPARIVAIADIFEALTAPDRPYREPGPLSRAVEILHRMVLSNHIDGDLFRLFLSSGVYREYAREFLAPAQLDPVEVARYLQQTDGS